MITQATLDALEARFGPTTEGRLFPIRQAVGASLSAPSVISQEQVHATISQLVSTPTLLLEARNGLTRIDLAWKPSDHEYSIFEHLCHLRDMETQRYGVHICRMLAADQPWLMAAYCDKLAEDACFYEQHALAVINDFFKLRLANIQRIHALVPMQGLHDGRLSARGSARAANVIRTMMAHDQKHLETIRGIRKTLLTL
jgi:hypothetical protein